MHHDFSLYRTPHLGLNASPNAAASPARRMDCRPSKRLRQRRSASGAAWGESAHEGLFTR